MGDLDLYLALERMRATMDDAIADLMDRVWYRLSAAEIATLDGRQSTTPPGQVRESAESRHSRETASATSRGQP